MKNFRSNLPATFLFFTTIISCSDKKEQKPASSPTVNMVVAGQITLPVFSEYVGETLGKEDVQIQSRTDGWVTGIHFKEGDLVKKDQLLYTIDDMPVRNKLDQAEAKLAEANTSNVKNKADLDRVEPLTEMHALSKRDLDAARASYQASMSESAAAAAALRNAKIELEYTRVKAPITGVIGISKVLVGDYIGKLNTGAPLNTISSIDQIRVRFSISEDEYLKFARQMEAAKQKIQLNKIPVQLLLSDGSVYEEQGYIDLSNRQIDPATGSLLVQARFQNNKGLIKPGQYVKVKLQTAIYKDAVMVPQQAIVQMQNLYTAFLINDSNIIKPILIKPGARVGSNWIVVQGIKPGDRLAMVGNAGVVKPGVIIQPQPMAWNYDSTSR